MILLPPSAPQAAEPAQSPSGSGWLADLASQPGFVETVLALCLVGAGLLLWLRGARLLRQTRARRAVTDYLYGVEQALSLDLKGARQRLQKVLAEDPENHFAQMLLGKVLADVGEPEKAHRHHLTLQRAFQVESSQNDLLLARCLLELGHAAEAADTAQRVADQEPRNAARWEFLFRARLQAGDPSAAATAGQRWLAVLDEPRRAGRAREEVAGALARSGSRSLWAGDRAAAEIAYRRAKALAPGLPEVARLGARLLADLHGTEATVTALLGEPGAGGPRVPEGAAHLLPATVPSGLPAGAVAVPGGADLQSLAALLPQSRWCCAACDSELPGRVAVCPTCGARNRAQVAEPRLFEPMESANQCMDSIEQNRAHIRRMVRCALEDRDAKARDTARADVLEMGEKAVTELLAEAWQRGGGENGAVEMLREMGPGITPLLFAAADELDQKRLLPLPGRSPMAVVGLVVQGFDRSALPHFEGLFGSARAEHRRVLIDYFLGLGDPAEFQIVLERFPPLEILQRMNQAEATVLRRFLQALPKGHFVADGLIVHPSFRREADVLRALDGAAHPDALEQALRKRGPSRAIHAALIAALVDPVLQPVARSLLRFFGPAPLDAMLDAFVEVEPEAPLRGELHALLAGAGPDAAERICAAFGPEPSSLDEALRGILVAMGREAIPGLEAAYGKRDWLEWLSGGFLQRHGNRRTQIAMALAEIGGDAAAAALSRLRREESDGNLRLRLDQALHQAGGTDAGQEDPRGGPD